VDIFRPKKTRLISAGSDDWKALRPPAAICFHSRFAAQQMKIARISIRLFIYYKQSNDKNGINCEAKQNQNQKRKQAQFIFAHRISIINEL